MWETTRYRPWAEPGLTDVMCVPNWTEHPEPGGANWTSFALRPCTVDPTRPRSIVQRSAVSRFTCHASAILGLGRGVPPERLEAFTEGQDPCGVERALVAWR